MAWFSLLPASMSIIETWLIRLFLFLSVVCMGPWILLLIYDACLFVIRSTIYEMPVIGSRARINSRASLSARPREPSVTERPDGQPRDDFLGVGCAHTTPAEVVEAVDEIKRRLEAAASADAVKEKRAAWGDLDKPGHLRVPHHAMTVDVR